MSAKRKTEQLLILWQILKSSKFKWLQFTLMKIISFNGKKSVPVVDIFLRLFILIAIQLLIVRAICKSL